MSILCYLWIIILVPSLVCPDLLERACPFWFCVSCHPFHLLLINQGLVELVKGLQNLKTNKEDASLQEVPPLGKHVNGKLKLMCRFGGRILPRTYDGNLRYVGGQTRIISANQGITFSELMQKLVNTYGQSLAIEYQLPDEELDSLVSVTCDEDLQNMTEEYAGYPGTNYGPRIPLFLSSVLRDKQVSHQHCVNHVVERGITSSSDNGSGDPVSIPSYCKASFQPVPPRAVNEKAKNSSRLNSLLQCLPSSGSFFAFMVGNAKESPNPAADISVSRGPEGLSLENVKSPLPSLTHRTTQDAFESPLPRSQGISARRVEFEAVDRALQVIENADLEELQKLGSGTFGTVYHGKWRGTDVAIKWIKTRCFSGGPSQHEKMREDFWSEASLLAQLHHPNIIAFYGVVLEGRRGALGTVTEYMVDGSLKHVLQHKDRPIGHYNRVLLAMDAAFGMEYLHAKNIVHFDIKSDNLLVNMRDPQRPICKIGDFGLSETKHHTFVSGGVRETLPWMAPELLRGSNSMVSEKVDVYSFGIVMWELLTGEEPYADMNDPAIIGGVLCNSLRPPVPHNCDPQWRALMEACWSSDPSARPSFTDVVSRLRAMAIYSQRAWDII